MGGSAVSDWMFLVTLLKAFGFLALWSVLVLVFIGFVIIPLLNLIWKWVERFL